MNNEEFLQKVDDIVVVSTHNRPDLMVNQVLSFVDNMELFTNGYRAKDGVCVSDMPEVLYSPRFVQFLFVDDSDSSYEQEYLKQLDRLKALLRQYTICGFIGVTYLNKDQQIKIIKDFGAKAALSENRYESFFSDINGKKRYGGIRGICNIGRLLGLYFAHQSKKEVNLHFLDSDVFPFVMWNDGVDLKLSHKYYFFGHKAHILADQNTRVVGTYFDVDSPSPIIDLYEALWFLEMYMSKFTEVDINSPDAWREFAKEFVWIGENLSYDNIKEEVYQVDDKSLIDGPVLTLQGTFHSNLSKVEKLLHILLQGNNRFVFNTANYSKTSNWHGPRDYFGNGCISMRYSVARNFRPYPLFGNQELILFPYEYATRGGTFWGDLDVSHIKEPRGRLSLLDDLEMSTDGTYRQKHDFRQLYEIINYFESTGIEISKGIDIPRRRIKDDALKFSVYGESTVDKIGKLIAQIIQHCSKLDFQSIPVSKIATSARAIDAAMPNIKNQYDFQLQEGVISSENKKLVDDWISSFDDWNKLIREVVR